MLRNIDETSPLRNFLFVYDYGGKHIGVLAGGQHGLWINILLRVVLIPLVAGISYEIIKISGRSQSKIARIINAPGLMFQAFTTRSRMTAR